MAAAGRALRTQTGSFALELTGEQTISAEQVSQLEAGAVSAAEDAMQMDEESRRQFFLVGYTVAQYRLDRYPLSTLMGHKGRLVEADVVATFLPGEVVGKSVLCHACGGSSGGKHDVRADCRYECGDPGGAPPFESGAGRYRRRNHRYCHLPGMAAWLVIRWRRWQAMRSQKRSCGRFWWTSRRQRHSSGIFRVARTCDIGHFGHRDDEIS